MSITLSSDDLRRLESVTRLLARPLDLPHVDDWRAQVVTEIRELIGADTAGFHLPVEQGTDFLSPDFSPGELESRPYRPPPLLPDGTCTVRRGIEIGVGTLEGLYGMRADLYRTSDFFTEYARPLGKEQILFASVGWGDLSPQTAGSLQFHRARSPQYPFGPRETALLRLVYPALTAGIDAWRRWDRWRGELLRMLDDTLQAAAVFGADGALLHRTPALNDLLTAEEDREVLTAQLAGAAGALVNPAQLTPLSPPPASEVITASACYTLRVCTYDGGANAPLLAVATLTRLTPALRADDDLIEAYQLTRAEVRVATFLAEGLTNTEIAQRLVISPHTARRHTERVLRKLGVRSRSEVASRVYA